MNSKQPNTSVVILNWNGAHWLKLFLPSLIEHTPQDLADLIVVDNASSDDSLAVLKNDFPSIKILKFDRNFGYAGGYNRAVEQLDYRYMVLLNSDVELTMGWLLPLIDRLKSDDAIVACQPKILDYKMKTHFEYAGASGGFIDYLGYPFCRGRIFDTQEEDHLQYNDAKPVFWASGACLAIKKEAFVTVGGFDETFFAHMEEIDLCWRFHRNRKLVYVEPASVVYHAGGGTLSKISPQKTYLNFRNNLLLLYKNFPAGRALKIIFFRLILDGVAGLKFIVDGHFMHALAIVKAHFHFYKMISRYKPKTTRVKDSGFTEELIIYPKAVIWQYFVKKRKKYSDL
ncbi:MAG: glycosyltransferase family 2 protein [Bacteroidales bacterium]|nr:glycosyltransferase family 2 protein [Bacteroidales bacterium]